MSRIILASQSPRRKKLLEQIGLSFEVHPSAAEEVIKHSDPQEIVEDLALLKAKDVAHNFKDSLVIGADTIVVYQDEILGKPSDPQQALSYLQQLSGNTHSVFTGVALVKTDKNGAVERTTAFNEQTNVVFSTLEIADMKAYVGTGNPMDKAGAYGIQDDLGALFVEMIEGDYYNVVGFPLNRFYRELKLFSPDLKLFSE
ncbi:MAG: septum formation inhibitor Maf [Balneola sp.]|nr:septum formation inhibitor Maf [Balneola sp.]|tara:strand:- start:5510 stop:6109 length:600 start_codon:yes stop_codon:yes gene_type:complete